MIDKSTRGIVLICDRVISRESVDIYTDDLEFTSNVYFNAIFNALKNSGKHYTVYDSPKDFIDNIASHKNDVVLSAIWSGTKSRNRKSLLPAICESYEIDYVGADAYVQTICQDKNLSKIFCSKYDIEIPKGYTFTNCKNIQKINNLNFPVIVKPNCEGSSIGISDQNIADNYEQAVKLVKTLLEKYSPILVEEYIDGKEISICCVGKNQTILCEAISLVIDNNEYFNHQIWGYETKKCGKSQVKRRNVTSEVSDTILKEASHIFHDLGKVDYMRIDGRIYDDKFYLIELTPDCSLHPECFMAESFYTNGYSYDQMIWKLLSFYE